MSAESVSEQAQRLWQETLEVNEETRIQPNVITNSDLQRFYGTSIRLPVTSPEEYRVWYSGNAPAYTVGHNEPPTEPIQLPDSIETPAPTIAGFLQVHAIKVTIELTDRRRFMFQKVLPQMMEVGRQDVTTPMIEAFTVALRNAMQGNNLEVY